MSKIRIVLQGGLTAFVIYFCMYAFRKPFAAATFSEPDLWNIDFKVMLVIAQVLGYTISKFIGIRFISEHSRSRRALYIVAFIGFAELALLGYALVSHPFKPLMLFLNGLPLGMIWGLVFAYLEGRTITELLSAMLSASYIAASGITKSVGKWLMNAHGFNEFWMPFATGALFLVPLLLALFLIEKIPAPDEIDVAHRRKRVSMSKADRQTMFKRLAPGILGFSFILLLATAFRDIRDNFAAELWAQLGYASSASVFSTTEMIISAVVLVFLVVFVFFKNNVRALQLIQFSMVFGASILVGSTFLYEQTLISPFLWMTLSGLGLYITYVPMGSIIFERISAIFDFNSNAGFLIYIADAISYLGSVMVLLVKELFYPELSFFNFFTTIAYVVGVSILILLTFTFYYFNIKTKNIHGSTGNIRTV